MSKQPQEVIRTKVKKAKVAPSNNKPYVVVPKHNSEADSSQRPRLVPPATLNYNIVKRLLADVYLKQPTHCLYHLWLHCLYDEEVTFETILENLKPVLGPLNRGDIPPRYVYLVASQPSDDVPPKPAGSCFIMISNSLIKKRAKSLDRFELKILYNRMHMFKVSVPMLREHLKDSCSLVFTEAFTDLINVPVKLLRTIMDMPADVVSDVLQPQKQVVGQPQPQPPQAKPKQPQQQKKQQSSPPPQPLQQKQQKPSKSQVIPSGESQAFTKKTPTTTKRNRIAALLNGGLNMESSNQDELINVLCSDSSNDLIIDENPPNKFESPNKKNKLDEKLLKSLRNLGNVVIRLDNLPAKLNVQALNLMMGTFSLTSDQIVASKRQRNGQELMNTRIVMHSNCIIDMQKILTKNGFQTYYDSILHVELTNFDELSQFLTNNHDNIHRLDKDDKLPINAIGYSIDRDCDWQHKSFKVSLKQNV